MRPHQQNNGSPLKLKPANRHIHNNCTPQKSDYHQPISYHNKHLQQAVKPLTSSASAPRLQQPHKCNQCILEQQPPRQYDYGISAIKRHDSDLVPNLEKCRKELHYLFSQSRSPLRINKFSMKRAGSAKYLHKKTEVTEYNHQQHSNRKCFCCQFT